MKLDYNLKTLEERRELVNKILEENPNPSPKYLDVLADYLVLCMDKDEKKEKKILTENRLATVNKRETSYEGLVAQFENGEDGVYNLLSNDKNVIFRPKAAITEEDLEEIPELRDCRKSIEFWENVLKTATGKDAFVAKRSVIEFRKLQYNIKSAFKPMVAMNKNLQQPRYHNHTRLDGYITFDEEGYCVPHGVTLVDPNVCSAVMCNYSFLRSGVRGVCDSDLYYLLEQFDDVSKRALKDKPLYMAIMKDKIDEMQNIDIQADLEQRFGIKHSLEYISSLWRKKIPAVIASQAEDDYLYWYYTNKEYGKWKKCSKCGEIKLAHNKYFSKNSTSKDGFYSICKECRNKKTKEKKGELNG